MNEKRLPHIITVMAGANSVIVINISYGDKSGRLTLKVFDVETAEIIAMARQEF